MDSIKQCEPQQSADCVLKKNFLLPSDHPGLMVPRDIIKIAQLLHKRAVVAFIGRNHFFQRRGTFVRMPAHARVVRASLAGAEIDTSLFERHQ